MTDNHLTNQKSLQEKWQEHMHAKKLDLRWHLISAIAEHEGWEESAIALVDEAIMPIIQSEYPGDGK